MMAADTFGVLALSLGRQVEHDLIGSPTPSATAPFLLSFSS
jgi:hypothetical protein